MLLFSLQVWVQICTLTWSLCNKSHPHSSMGLTGEVKCGVGHMFPVMCCTSGCTRPLYLALPTLIVLDSKIPMSYLWLWWQLCSRDQWIHVWTLTSFVLNPTWMKPAHSINSAYHVCFESWMQFMPRKLQAIKNTFYAKFKTPSLMICLHSYNCIDSNKASPHLVQQKQEKDQAFAFNLPYGVVQRYVQTWL